jgi:4,5-DOPA dioxygenase extradiol
MTEASYGGPERRQPRQRRVPALFVSHGSPQSLFDQEWGNALRRFAAHQASLDAIVAVSAHWESLRPVRITRSPRPELLFDFTGMPSSIERHSYAPMGQPKLADEVIAMLEAAGIRAVADPTRGLDHGVWIPIAIAYPSGRVPIVQISLPAPAEPQEILALGRALAPLRDRNILLMGSGGLVHNLHRVLFARHDHVADPWALGFEQWVRDQVGRLDVEALLDYRRRAPHALESVPTPEHLAPLFFVLGAAETGDRVYDVYEGFRHGSLSMRAFVLAGRRREDLRGVRTEPAPESL